MTPPFRTKYITYNGRKFSVKNTPKNMQISYYEKYKVDNFYNRKDVTIHGKPTVAEATAVWRRIIKSDDDWSHHRSDITPNSMKRKQ